MKEHPSPIITVSSVRLLTQEEALDFLIDYTESLKMCKKHDHREDILQMEKLQKFMLSNMKETLH